MTSKSAAIVGFMANRCVLMSLIIVAALAFTGCSTEANKRSLHASDLTIQTDAHNILPSRASTKDGKPYTGDVYETFFGGKQPKNCAEWEGAFIDGMPTGEFKLYTNCGQLDSLWRFENGAWGKVEKT